MNNKNLKALAYVPLILIAADFILVWSIGSLQFFSAPFREWRELSLELPLVLFGLTVGVVAAIKSAKFKHRALLTLALIGALLCLCLVILFVHFAIRQSSPYYDWGA